MPLVFKADAVLAMLIEEVANARIDCEALIPHETEAFRQLDDAEALISQAYDVVRQGGLVATVEQLINDASNKLDAARALI
jgi:hypothetical protein